MNTMTKIREWPAGETVQKMNVPIPPALMKQVNVLIEELFPELSGFETNLEIAGWLPMKKKAAPPPDDDDDDETPPAPPAESPLPPPAEAA